MDGLMIRTGLISHHRAYHVLWFLHLVFSFKHSVARPHAQLDTAQYCYNNHGCSI